MNDKTVFANMRSIVYYRGCNEFILTSLNATMSLYNIVRLRVHVMASTQYQRGFKELRHCFKSVLKKSTEVAND